MAPSTILALLFILLITLCSFFYILHTISAQNDRKLPPGPYALPIIGNLHMLGNLPHQNLHYLAKKFGPIMSLRLGYVPTIVISSPQTAELFLKTHDVVFASRPKTQAWEYLSFGRKGLAFTDYGSYWRTVRRWCILHLLSASKVEYFAPMRKAELEGLVESVKKAAATSETMDLTRKVGEFIEAMTYKMIVGRSKDDSFDLKRLIQYFFRLSGVFNLADYVPYLDPLDLQGLTRRLKEESKVIDKLLDKIIDEHEQRLSNFHEEQNHRDFVDVMVSLVNKPMNSHDGEQEYIIDRTNIKAIILDMIAGSFDTSATAINWAMSELLRHPRVMLALQRELESVVGRNRMVEESDLPKLTYLNMVIKENLRLHPSIPTLIPHEFIEDITVNGYFIPKKSRILINTWSMARDSNVWSDNAKEFYPERFMSSNIDVQGHDFQLIPFGAGRRVCPGMQLGLITIRLVLAQLVHCFDWELPNGMSPTDLDMREKFGLTVPRANHLLVKPTYRIIHG